MVCTIMLQCSIMFTMSQCPQYIRDLLLCLLQFRKNQSRIFLSGLLQTKDRNMCKKVIILSSGDYNKLLDISTKISNSIFFTITQLTQFARTMVMIVGENKTRQFQVYLMAKTNLSQTRSTSCGEEEEEAAHAVNEDRAKACVRHGRSTKTTPLLTTSAEACRQRFID